MEYFFHIIFLSEDMLIKIAPNLPTLCNTASLRLFNSYKMGSIKILLLLLQKVGITVSRSGSQTRKNTILESKVRLECVPIIKRL